MPNGDTGHAPQQQPQQQQTVAEKIPGVGQVVDWWGAHLGPQALEPSIHAGLERQAQDYESGQRHFAEPVHGRAGEEFQGLAAPPPTKEADITQEAKIGSEAASAEANPLNWLMLAPGIGEAPLAARLALFAAAPAVQDMLSQNADESLTSILWSGAAAALMGGIFDIPGPMRRALEGAMPGLFRQAQHAQQINRIANDWSKSPWEQPMTDYIQKELEEGNKDLADRERVLQAEAPKRKRDPETGELQLTPGQREKRQKFLKKYGVQSEEELKAKAAADPTNPIFTNTDWLIDNWKNSLFTDPLYSEEHAPMEYKDPGRHLANLSLDEKRQAALAVGHFSGLRDAAQRGVSHGFPGVGLFRQMFGFNPALDLLDREFAGAVRAIDPNADGNELRRIVEMGAEGEEDYNKLTPAQQFQVDMFRMNARMTRAYQRRSGLPVSDILSYIPRIPKVGVKLGRREAKGGRVMVSEYGKHRGWRVEAVPRLFSVDTAALEPLRRQLGKAADGLDHDTLGKLWQLNERLSQGDSEHMFQELRQQGGQNLRRTIEDWDQRTRKETDPNDLRLRLVQMFRTVDEHNDHLANRREQFVDAFMNNDVSAMKDMGREVGLNIDPKDPELRRIVEEKDEAAARREANHIFAERETDLFKIMQSGHFARQMKAAHTRQAINEMARTKLKDIDGTGRTGYAVVMSRGGEKGKRINERYRQLGYDTVDQAGRAYQNYLWAPEMQKMFKRASAAADLGIPRFLYKIEQLAIRTIMYNPVIHGMNMAGRLATVAGQHPLLTAAWMKHITSQKALGRQTRHPDQRFIQLYDQLRHEAFQNGVVTPYAAREGVSKIPSTLAQATGDQDMHDLGIARQETEGRLEAMQRSQNQGVATFGKVLGKVGDFNEYSQNQLWSRISDFGVMVYHIEKTAAMRSGVSEANASLWAARRANTMMGHVSHLDQNPNLHAMARLAFFAPNWWRTFAEEQLPIYKNSGIEWDGAMRGYVMKNQVATIISELAVQKVIGEAANWLFSGHWQNQNDGGRQDYIEIQRPEIIRAMQATGLFENIDANTGTDPQTGGHIYFENPFARQQLAVETALGKESGYDQTNDWWAPDHLLPRPSDIGHGMSKELAARLSPLLNTGATLGNLDLYSSIMTGTIRNSDPTRGSGLPPVDPRDPHSLDWALAAAQLTPLGFGAQALGQQFQQGRNAFSGTNGPFGTHPPKWAANMAAGMPVKALFGMLGVNTPFVTAGKTRGEDVSDANYRQLQAEQQTYQSQLSTLGQQLFSGQITPQQWTQDYYTKSQQHSAVVKSLIGSSPDYTHGTLGLTNSWEQTFTDSMDGSTGVIDPDKLAALQSEWRTGTRYGRHTESQYQAVQAQLRKNDQADPALKLFHDTIATYKTWQAQQAAQLGISVATLQAESRQYSALYASQPAAAAQYLATHPELAQFYASRRTQFFNTPAGLAYGLYFGSTTAGRLLQSYGMTPAQLLSAEAQAEAAGILGPGTTEQPGQQPDLGQLESQIQQQQ